MPCYQMPLKYELRTTTNCPNPNTNPSRASLKSWKTLPFWSISSQLSARSGFLQSPIYGKPFEYLESTESKSLQDGTPASSMAKNLRTHRLARLPMAPRRHQL